MSKISDTLMKMEAASINTPGANVPLWMFEEWPVVSGDVVLSYGELDRKGKSIMNLPEGQWFATITANQDLNGMEVATGWVEHQGVGATCIRLNRSWDNAYWVAGETKVLVIPDPFKCMECGCKKGVCIHEECDECGGMEACA